MALQLSKNIDEVSRNSIWREHCRKENSKLKMSDTFSIPNPQRMTILPEKPNYTVPRVIRPDSDEVLQATQKLASLCNAKHTHQLPNQTHMLPVSSNMEYGFNYTPLFQTHPMFQYRKTKCDVTAYAETYCAAMGGQSPFAKRTLDMSAAKAT
ncbi:hypothetical protein WJX72_000838 [[Myrmecia] bisecta]|uniref:Uncharacterized protein n=1 Tax=[Myrmecia] bisecta TaxID=41462 RepID=A0AAW1QP21_9CHLO